MIAELFSAAADHWFLAILAVLAAVWVGGAVILMVLTRSVSKAAAFWPLLVIAAILGAVWN